MQRSHFETFKLMLLQLFLISCSAFTCMGAIKWFWPADSVAYINAAYFVAGMVHHSAMRRINALFKYPLTG